MLLYLLSLGIRSSCLFAETRSPPPQSALLSPGGPVSYYYFAQKGKCHWVLCKSSIMWRPDVVQYTVGTTVCGSSVLEAFGGRVMAYDYLANWYISSNDISHPIEQTNSCYLKLHLVYWLVPNYGFLLFLAECMKDIKIARAGLKGEVYFDWLEYQCDS